MKIKISLLIIFILITLMLNGCTPNNSQNKYEETQLKMDTTMTITAYGDGSEAAVKNAFKRIDEIEQLASLNIETSEVNKINNAAGKQFVPVHPEIYKLVKEAVKYSQKSNGAFDITVGPISKLWNFGTKDERVPGDEEIKSKLALVGYQKIKFNDSDNSVMLEKQGMIIDLGGIAKGYAADEVYKALIRNGIKKAIINLGGSTICVIGSKDNNTPWSIGIQHPRKDRAQGFMGILKSVDKSISTSGDYERFFIKDGKRYHHILNPSTGYPANSGVISDTITIDNSAANSNMDADVLSTVMFVLGPEKAMQFIKSFPDIGCIIVTSDNRVISTDNIKDKISSISEDLKYDSQGR